MSTVTVIIVGVFVLGYLCERLEQQLGKIADAAGSIQTDMEAARSDLASMASDLERLRTTLAPSGLN